MASLAHARSAIRCLFRRRRGRLRAIVVLSASLMLLHDVRTKTAAFLYTNEKFGWSSDDYAVYASVDTAHNFCRALVVLPLLSRWLGMHDAMIGVLGSMNWIIYYLVVGKDFACAARFRKKIVTQPSSIKRAVLYCMLHLSFYYGFTSHRNITERLLYR